MLRPEIQASLSSFHQESQYLPPLLLILLMSRWVLFTFLVYLLFSISFYILWSTLFLHPCYSSLLVLTTYFISAFSSLWLSVTNLSTWAQPFIFCTLGCMNSLTLSLTNHTNPPYSPTLTCLNSRTVSSWSWFFSTELPPHSGLPLVAQMIKNLPAMWENGVQSLSREDPLEKGMATHSSIFAWRIPWTEELGRLQSMGSQRDGHNWASNTFTVTTPNMNF